MTTEFIPVLMMPTNKADMEKLVFGGKNMCWWQKEKSFYYHRSFLLTAEPYREYPNIREILEADDEAFFMADSGGFQLASRPELDIKPLDVLRWQEANADIAFLLDKPTGLAHDTAYYEECMKFSVHSADVEYHNRESDKLELLNVLHGATIDQKYRWYEAMSPYPFEGWAVAWHSTADLFGYAMNAMFLHEVGDTNILHFLGTSGWTAIPLLVYLGEHVFNKIYFDSSSYGSAMRYRRYTIPRLGMTWELRIGRVNTTEDMVDLPCDCPVCSVVKKIDVLIECEDDTLAGVLIGMHNLYQYKWYTEFLTRLVKNREVFMAYLKQNGLNKTIKAINYVDACLSAGFTTANREFQSSLANNSAVGEIYGSDLFTKYFDMFIPAPRFPLDLDTIREKERKKKNPTKKWSRHKKSDQKATTFSMEHATSLEPAAEEEFECFTKGEKSDDCDPVLCGERFEKCGKSN